MSRKQKKIDVIILHTNGAFVEKKLAADEFGAELGGLMEALPNKKADRSAYVDEDGYHKKLPQNAWSNFLRQEGYVFTHPVVGKVLLCSLARNGNDTSISKGVKLSVTRYFSTHFERALGGEESVSSETVESESEQEMTQAEVQQIVEERREQPTTATTADCISTCFSSPI